MDVASLLTLLLLALALAVQPWSVLAAVLLVTSEGGVAKAMAYVSGWVLALAAVAAPPGSPSPGSQPPSSQSPSSQSPGSQPPGSQPPSSRPPSPQPKWMVRLDSMSLLPAFVLGAFLPNYAVVVAVGNVIQAGLSQARAAAVLGLSSSLPQPESQPHCCCWCSVRMTPLRSIRGGEPG